MQEKKRYKNLGATCRTSGCDLPVGSHGRRGKCLGHLRHGDDAKLDATGSLAAPDYGADKCASEGCPRKKGRSRGLCRKCADAERAAGNYVAPNRTPRKNDGPCADPECDVLAVARGYCNTHHGYAVRDGVLETIQTQEPGRTCEEPGCDRKHFAHGLCVTHGERKYRPGYGAKKMRRRRSRIKAFPPITLPDQAARLSMFSVCWICGNKSDEFHVDHVKPVVADGPNYLSNLRNACPPCNMSKNGRWPFSTSTAATRLDPSRLP